MILFPFHLPAQEGVLSLIMDSEETFSGRIRILCHGWELLGAAERAGDENGPELGNLLLQTPWGGVGSLITRGILKELETPSLSRAPQTPGQSGPGFDTSFKGSPRRGFILGSPGGPGGVAVWSYQERQNLGVWYENRGLPGNSWGAGLLLREGKTNFSTDWLEETPSSLSPWLVSTGLWGHLRFPLVRGGAGVFWVAAPADPPGVWGRVWGEIRVQDFKGGFAGGVSSPRVWSGGGGRLKELAFYRLSASWKPWKPLTLEVRFSETQDHLGYLSYSYRPHQVEGEGILIFRGNPGELKGTVLRVIKHDERGEAEIGDVYSIKGTWTPGDLKILGKVTGRLGSEDRIDFSGSLGYTKGGAGLTLEAALGREGDRWYREGGLEAVWGDDKNQFRIAVGIRQEDGGTWQGMGKISLQWKLYDD